LIWTKSKEHQIESSESSDDEEVIHQRKDVFDEELRLNSRNRFSMDEVEENPIKSSESSDDEGVARCN